MQFVLEVSTKHEAAVRNSKKEGSAGDISTLAGGSSPPGPLDHAFEYPISAMGYHQNARSLPIYLH
jgi:hypothetical protein